MKTKMLTNVCRGYRLAIAGTILLIWLLLGGFAATLVTLSLLLNTWAFHSRNNYNYRNFRPYSVAIGINWEAIVRDFCNLNAEQMTEFKSRLSGHLAQNKDSLLHHDDRFLSATFYVDLSELYPDNFYYSKFYTTCPNTKKKRRWLISKDLPKEVFNSTTLESFSVNNFQNGLEISFNRGLFKDSFNVTIPIIFFNYVNTICGFNSRNTEALELYLKKLGWELTHKSFEISLKNKYCEAGCYFTDGLA